MDPLGLPVLTRSRCGGQRGEYKKRKHGSWLLPLATAILPDEYSANDGDGQASQRRATSPREGWLWAFRWSASICRLVFCDHRIPIPFFALEFRRLFRPAGQPTPARCRFSPIGRVGAPHPLRRLCLGVENCGRRTGHGHRRPLCGNWMAPRLLVGSTDAEASWRGMDGSSGSYRWSGLSAKDGVQALTIGRRHPGDRGGEDRRRVG